MLVTRRTALQRLASLGLAFTASPLEVLPQGNAPKRFQIALMNTIVDWFLSWPLDPPLKWEVNAVKRILDLHAEGGNKTVYWRTMDGGKAMYRTKLAEIAHGPEGEATIRAWKESNPALLKHYQTLDCNQFDILGTAVEYGHKLGMKVVAWAEIYHEDHGLGPTAYQLKHPQFKRIYRGYRHPAEWGELSWAFPEVREYKLGLLKEMLSYGVDGIFFDMVRGRDPIDDEGVNISGYEAPTVSGYQKEYGLDPFRIPNGEPTWIEYRSRVIHAALQETRALLNRYSGKELILYTSGINNPMTVPLPEVKDGWSKTRGVPMRDEYRSSFIQTVRWAREGLFDTLCTSHWPWTKDNPNYLPPLERFKAQINHYLPLVQGHARYMPEFYGFGVSTEEFEQILATIKEMGSDGAVISEDGCFIGKKVFWKDLAKFNARFLQG